MCLSIFFSLIQTCVFIYCFNKNIMCIKISYVTSHNNPYGTVREFIHPWQICIHIKHDIRVLKSNMLKEKNTSQLFKPMSIKLCRQQVVSRFWSAQSGESNCARLQNPTGASCARESFLTYVDMTSEPGGPFSDASPCFNGKKEKDNLISIWKRLWDDSWSS